MICPVDLAISINAYEGEQYSANDYFQALKKDEVVNILGTTYEFWEITDMIDVDTMREAFQLALTEGESVVAEVYINKIKRMMI